MDKKAIAFKGTPVFNPHKPRDLRFGGYVYEAEGMTEKQLNNDSVIAVLRPGEIVIPVQHRGINLARKTEKWLRNQKITLPFMKR
jgi:hypothetical protein